MPKAVSKKQFRMMQAILHGSKGTTGRGDHGPPKSVAAKYIHEGGTGKKHPVDKDLPESKGKEHSGGNWDHPEKKHRESDKKRVEHKRHEKTKAKHKHKSKKELKKAFEEFYKGNAAAAIVMDSNNRILLGQHCDGKLAFAGGHVDAADQGDFAVAALRELKEEMGIVGLNPNKIWEGKENGNNVSVFLVDSWKGQPKSTEEIKNPKWVEPHEIKWDKLRDCCHAPLKHLIETKLGKSLKGLLAKEVLEKNIIRQKGDAVFEVTHGDALKLVGNGLFRKIKSAVADMKDEDFKDIIIDTHKVSIRKHMNDVYSGRVIDGHKQVYQFTHKSLPELTAALMSVFEWYLPEDEELFDVLDEKSLPDDAIHGGLNELIENYKRHNIGNIYSEMEDIRENIRNGVAVDIQQVEARIMKLFDRLEQVINTVADKHNMLAEKAGLNIDDIEKKLIELQSKIEEMNKKPEKIEAFSANPPNKDKVIEQFYSYLSRPKIEVLPSGKITIMFDSDWQDLEKQNFLSDMKAKVIKKAGKQDG